MKKNEIKIIIDKPVEDVFEYTTNPENTHKWIPSVEEEVAEQYPPEIGTVYKNRGINTEWDIYEVLEFEENEVFALANKKDNYMVRYTYRKLDDSQTEMIYFECVKEGELSNPFTDDILLNLKSVIESEDP